MTPSLIPGPFGADHTPEPPSAVPMPELPVTPDYITPPLPDNAPMTELRATTTVTHEDAKGPLTSVAVVCGILGFMLMGVSLWLTLVLWVLAAGAWWLRTDPTTSEEAVYRVPLESPAHRLWSGTGESAGLDAFRLQRTIRQAADVVLAADRVPYGHDIEVTRLDLDDSDEAGDVIVGLAVPALLTTGELQALALETADDLRITGICGAERTADGFYFFLTSMNAQHYNVHVTEPPPKAPEPPKPAGPRFSKA